MHEFAGSYYISIDNPAFGEPYKYVQLELSLKEADSWDESLSNCDNRFFNEEHNICL